MIDHAKPPPNVPGRAYRRTLSLLEALSEEPEGIPAMEMLRRLSIPKTSFFLMLQHCREHGFVSTADGVVRPGPSLVRAAFALVESFTLRRVARPILESLSRETGQDVYLGTRNGDHALYIDVAEHPGAVHVNIARGTPRPLHATAIGKLLLAYAPTPVIDAFLATRRLASVTKRTIVDAEVLAPVLRQVRACGYAVSDGEAIEGITAVAVPIFQGDEVVAGISMAWPGGVATADVEGLVERMRATARRIEDAQTPDPAATALAKPKRAAGT